MFIDNHLPAYIFEVNELGIILEGPTDNVLSELG